MATDSQGILAKPSQSSYLKGSQTHSDRLEARSTAEEVGRIVDLLEAAFGPPNRSAQQREIMGKLWVSELCSFDFETLRAAAISCCRDLKGFPSLHEMRQRIISERKDLREKVGRTRTEMECERADWRRPTPEEKAYVAKLAATFKTGDYAQYKAVVAEYEAVHGKFPDDPADRPSQCVDPTELAKRRQLRELRERMQAAMVNTGWEPGELARDVHARRAPFLQGRL